jgi:hypothetical protein
MLYAMAMAIAGLSSDLTEFDGESAEHFVLDMFHVAAHPADTMIAAEAMIVAT